MRISVFKKRFYAELEALYPTTEVRSFFNLLLEHFMGWTAVDLALHPQKELTETREKEFSKALSRLKHEEPIQYILGETAFYGLRFKVNRNVLIPRPETEELVAWVIRDVQSSPRAVHKTASSQPGSASVSILDIGTGSGCISISLAKELDAEISGIDLSAKALLLAHENARLNEVEVSFLEMDILHHKPMVKKFDIIVSNPPYVRELEKTQMQNNVLTYEPHQALFVKDDNPLLFYREILKFAKTHLKAGGRLFFEINPYLQSDLEQLFKDQGNFDYTFKKDIFGHWRMAKLTKK